MKKFILFATIFLVAVMIIGCKDPEVPQSEPAHEHTFADSWSKNATHHWKEANCEHTEEVSKFGEHTFGEYVSNKDATTEADGTKTRVCSVCKYEDTVTDTGSKIHVHAFESDWFYDGTHHWKTATCEHTEEVGEKAAHTFGAWTTTEVPTEEKIGIREQGCSVCNYKKTDEIEKNPTGFVYVKAGTFQMGNTAGEANENPVHEVTLTKNFYMSKYEVTQSEYCRYGGSQPLLQYGEGENYPVYNVSWYDALVYCNKRSIDEGITPCYSINGETDPTKWGAIPNSNNDTWNAVVCDWNADGYRLPTEAEWEYAARAGNNTTNSIFYSGTSDQNELGDYSWYYDNSNGTTHEVGTKKANAFGLYDMTGNVRELCWNWETSSYDTNTEGGSDPTGALSGSKRVCRGGCWENKVTFLSVSIRNNSDPYKRSYLFGFRVVRTSSK